MTKTAETLQAFDRPCRSLAGQASEPELTFFEWPTRPSNDSSPWEQAYGFTRDAKRSLGHT